MKFDKIKKEIVIDLVGLVVIFLIFFIFGKVRQESKNGGASRKCGSDKITAPIKFKQSNGMPSLWLSQDS